MLYPDDPLVFELSRENKEELEESKDSPYVLRRLHERGIQAGSERFRSLVARYQVALNLGLER